MLDGAAAADVAVDLHVVRRVGEYEVGALPAQQGFKVDRAARIAAQQLVTTKDSEIVVPRYRLPGCERDPIFFSVEVEVDERLKFHGEYIAVSSGVKCKLVVGDHIGAPFSRGEMRAQPGLGAADQTALPPTRLCRQLDIGKIEKIATTAFEAALVMDELKAAGSILLAAGRMPERERYSLAHELGHFLLPSHRPKAENAFQCSLSDFHLLDERDRNQRWRIEAEANRFAAKVLMPPAQVRKQIGQGSASLESIVAMSREFKVSKEAMARAWVTANRNLTAVVVLHHGFVQRCYRGAEFPWIAIRKGKPMSEDSLAATELPTGTYSDIEEVDPEAWLCERDAKRTLDLTEQVLAQHDGYALALLQIEFDDE